MHRRIEAVRNRLMDNLGVERLIEETRVSLIITKQWRKPLSIVEINRMAPTDEVRARPGRA